MRSTLSQREFLISLGWLGLALSICMIAGLLINLDAPYDANGRFFGNDFITHWAAPHVALETPEAFRSLSDYNAHVEAHYGSTTEWRYFAYPPHALLVFAPISTLPYFIAFAAWTLFGILLYLGLLTRGKWRAFPVSILMVGLCAPALWLNAFFGQNGVLTASLTLGALLLMAYQPFVSGVLLGLLTIKPQLGILWPFLLLYQRRVMVCIVAALVTAILVLASITLLGVGIWESFFSVLIVHTDIISSAQLRLFETMACSWTLPLDRYGMPKPIAYGIYGAILIFTIISFLRSLKTAAPTSLLALRFTAATAVISPYLFNYDLVALTLAILWHFHDTPAMRRSQRIVYGLGYLLPALVFFLYFYLPITPFVLLAVYIMALTEANTPHDKATNPC